MNNEQWNSSGCALEMLQALKAESKVGYIEKVNQLQRFYIACCRAKLALLPQKDFKIGLDITEAYINNLATKENIQTQNWYTEAAVFGMDYDTSPERNQTIYKNIAVTLGMDIKESKNYAVQLGYFIDWTTLYATSFSGRIPEKYSKFLIPNLLRNEISDPFTE